MARFDTPRAAVRRFAWALLLAGLLACGRTSSLPGSSKAAAGEGGGGSSAVGGGVAGGLGGACGNGSVDEGEQCDGRDLGGMGCAELGFAGGALGCGSTCAFDTSSCWADVDVDPRCFDAAVGGGVSDGCAEAICDCNSEATSKCDDECWALIACVERSCAGDGNDLPCIVDACGSLLNAAPAAMETGACLSDADVCRGGGRRCGDGVIDSGESCDGGNLGGQSCATLGFGDADSPLGCTADCLLDISRCSFDSPSPVCGDGRVGSGEQCDGSDLAGASCQSQGFVGGTLACDSGACDFDTGGCHRCGDGLIQAGERCDGAALDGLSCRDLGYVGGSLACDSGCALDAGGCSICGDGEVGSGEACDGGDLQGATCASLGFASGTLGCDPGVCLFDISSCSGGGVPSCGNGVAERGEECDGSDLTRLGCAELGFDSGSLACNVATCRFDISGCERTGNGDRCQECAQTQCGEVADACAARSACFGGLDCMWETCGGSADLGCGQVCFGSDIDAAVLALSLTACISNACGDGCLGAF
ncbi:MAG: hypothetical protein OEZ06_06620 [Myxococcales bacterium]|nr:hypothetical protein [Myxococcales bacterium]